VDDVAIALEHVDLLDGLDRLNIELLQRCLELLVVGTGALVDLLDLPTGSALTAMASLAQSFTTYSSTPVLSPHPQLILYTVRFYVGKCMAGAGNEGRPKLCRDVCLPCCTTC